jgi:hypothetical protein
MNLFSLDFTFPEIQLLRQSLNVITINGSDAQFVANLQVKLDYEMREIERLLQEEQTKKETLPTKPKSTK